MKNRITEIDGVVNTRDLGGLRIDSNNVTNTGKFYRAAALHDITPQGLEKFEELGIHTIIDLRSTMEVNQNPDPFASISGVEYHNIPMLDHLHSNLADGKNIPKFLGMEDLYVEILQNHKSEITHALDVLAESSNGTVFHCTVGKDRTGLTSMFLLTLAGVPQDIIVDDYSLSESFLKPYFEKVDKNISKFAYTSSPSVMRFTLDWLGKEYGGVEEYLNKINVSKKTQDSIRTKLILPIQQ